MKTKPIQRALSLVSALAMLLTVLAVPAFAAAPSATASLAVEDRLVEAGNANQVFDITVTNTGSTGGLLGLQGAAAPINAVVVTVPTYFAALGASGAPTGWNGQQLSNNRVIYRTNEGTSGIAPGSSLTFAVPGPVGQFSEDDGARFSVTVSSDGGKDLGPATPASSGALDSVVKVLSLPTFMLTAPAGATDLSVTNLQKGVEFEVTVDNLATSALTVTPMIVKKSGSSEIENVRIIKVGNAAASGPTVSIPAKDSVKVTFAADFKTVGNVTLNVAATAPGASAVGKDSLNRIVTVQAATSILYSDNTPKVAPAGPTTINTNFAKSGTPKGSLTTSKLVLKNGTHTKTVIVPTVDLVAGSQTLGIPYAVTFTPGVDPEGQYSGEFTHTGIDDNGATILITETVANLIKFDASLPTFANLQVLLPDGSAVTNEVPAAGNGRRIQVKGDVLDDGVSCPNCTIKLQLMTATGENVGTERTVTNNSGSFDTTFSVAGLPANVQAGTLYASMRATDIAGNGPGIVASPSVPFDTRESLVSETLPVTGGLGAAIGESETRNRIDVIFDEGVAVPFRTLPAQWSVSGARVDDAVIQSAVLQQPLVVKGKEERASGSPKDVNVTLPAGKRVWFARLTLGSDLAGNALPTVTYDPDANAGGSSGLTGAQTRIFDRVNLTTLKGVQEAFDNIAPELPVLSAVDNLGQQWANTSTKKFFANGGETLLTLTNVAPGTIVKVVINDNGTRTQVAQIENTDTSGTTVQAPIDLGGTAREIALEIQAFDSGAKNSTVVSYPIVVDVTAPAAVNAVFDGTNKVTITANDVMPYGADADLDFVIEAKDSKQRVVILQIVDVAKPEGSEGDPQTLGADAFLALNQRILTIDTSAYDPTKLTLVKVTYEAQFGDETVYVDRAGNKLASPTGFSF